MSTHDLKDAVALTIGYSAPGGRREIAISDPAEVKAITDSIAIAREQHGKQLGIDPHGYVDFKMKDGSEVSTSFVNATQLDRSHYGQVHLDEAFYRAVCAAASKHAGHPIDVLTDNPS